VPILLVPVLVVLALVALIPIALVQRYRMGVARQRARGWLIGINLVGLSLSMIMFILTAAVTSIWLHPALVYTILGLATGFVLGLIGLWFTRWEPTPDGLFFTPNRLLVLTITLVVTVRVLFGFWRAWHSWHAGLDDAAWVAAAGVAKSMAAGAVVLGYYFVYWIGVRQRLRLQRRARPVAVTTRRPRRRLQHDDRHPGIGRIEAKRSD
jgi:hypothetical protein